MGTDVLAAAWLHAESDLEVQRCEEQLSLPIVVIALEAALGVQGDDFEDVLIMKEDRTANHGLQGVTLSTLDLS